MCTSIAMTSGSFYFGRNLDLEHDFGQRVVITPRHYPFPFRCTERLDDHHAIIGMATVVDGYPLYADGANECGLCMAGLNFTKTAYYSPQKADGKANISPFELIPWVLGRCSTLTEARRLLENTHLVAIDFSRSLPLTPLHWQIADGSGSMVLEPARDGLRLHDNPVGILTNEPPFEFQLANLCHYLTLTPDSPSGSLSKLGLPLFGRGLGSVGLPGDFSPTSRFVKAAYLLHNSHCKPDEESSVSQFFHLLDSVAMVKGSVIAEGGQYAITRYSSCISAERGIYYYTTYDSRQITAVDLWSEHLDRSKLIEYPLQERNQIAWVNRPSLDSAAPLC